MTEEPHPVMQRPVMQSPVMQRVREEVREWVKFLAVAVPLYFAFTTVAFANYVIPSESMVPTIEVGDRVVVNKFAYGFSRFSLPLGLGEMAPAAAGRFLASMPRRGDVVVFRHPVERKVMIKRLIGLPGDTIEVRGGRLLVNDQFVERRDAQPLVRVAHSAGLENATRYREALPGGVLHYIDEFSDDASLDNFGPFVVPDGDFFAMGDNRDNSLDSRWEGMGPVPMENLIGRAEIIYFTMPHLRSEPGTAPPEPRLFRPLHLAAN